MGLWAAWAWMGYSLNRTGEQDFEGEEAWTADVC